MRLVATTSRPPAPGPSELEDVVVQVVGPSGERCRAGLYSCANIRLQPPASQQVVEGQIERQAFRGLAVFRGLRMATAGEHRFVFALRCPEGSGACLALTTPLSLHIAWATSSNPQGLAGRSAP